MKACFLSPAKEKTQEALHLTKGKSLPSPENEHAEHQLRHREEGS